MAKELKKSELADVPAYLEEAMKTDAGKGISTDAADNLVPLAYVLQGLSPQVDEANAASIPGAKAGDIWLRNYATPIIKGKDGMLFQPCYFSKDWVEWVPRERGGGFVARHDSRPSDAEDRDGKLVRRSSGNEVRETRYHSGFVHLNGGHSVPFVIPLTSTGHTVSRNWMFAMSQRTDANGNIEPSYCQLWRLKTGQRVNAKGKWYVFEPAFEDYVELQDFVKGKALYSAFASGERKSETPQDENQEQSEAF
jgi:hypothetical protein